MTDDMNLNNDTLSEALTLPSNREAEEALIGAVLIDQEVFLDISQFLEAIIFLSYEINGFGKPFNI